MLFFKLFNWDENIVVSENIKNNSKTNKKTNIIDEILKDDPMFFTY